MYTYQKVKCKKCGVEQELNSKEFIECPNGCYKIKLDRSGYSYSYKTDEGKENCIDRDIYKARTYFEERDFLEPDKELNELMDIIASYKDKLGCGAYCSRDYKKDGSGKEFLELFTFWYEDWDSSGQNTRFEIWKYFVNEYKFYDKEKILAETKKRMKDFADILEKLYKREFDITNRKYIWDNIDYLDCESKSKKLTDDVYYF